MSIPHSDALDLPAEEPDDLVVAIAALPEEEAVAAVTALVDQPRATTVPALQSLAASPRPAVASAAITALGRLTTSQAAGTLAVLGEQLQDKEQRKLARRTLHRLAAAGVRPAVEAAATTPRRPGLGADYRPYHGLASVIDGGGSRLVHLALIEAAGGIALLAALVNDERGLVHFTDHRLGRRRFDEERQELLKSEWPIFIEVPAEYARFLIADAITHAQEARQPLPVETLPWHDIIMSGQPTYQRALIYDYLDAAEVRWNPAYLEESRTLLETPELAGWSIDPELVAPFDPEEEAREARIVLPDPMQRQQAASAVQRAVTALFDTPARERWRRRLEEMAYLFLRRGSDRNARRAVAAALALERAPGVGVLGAGPEVHPVLAALVEQALERRHSQREQGLVRQGGLWVPRAAD